MEREKVRPAFISFQMVKLANDLEGGEKESKLKMLRERKVREREKKMKDREIEKERRRGRTKASYY